MEDLPYDVAMLATVDTIKLIANPLFLLEDTAYVVIEDYRGELPLNYVDIKKVVRVDENQSETSRTSLKISSDPYLQSYPDRDFNREYLPNGYRIQGDYVYTNFESGKVHVAFNKVPTDFEGTVMVPDRASIVKAIEFSIMASWLQKKWFAGKVTPDKFEWADRQRNWYIGQASADFALENLDKKESLSNILGTLILNDDHHSNDYKDLGTKEYRKRYI